MTNNIYERSLEIKNKRTEIKLKVRFRYFHTYATIKKNRILTARNVHREAHTPSNIERRRTSTKVSLYTVADSRDARHNIKVLPKAQTFVSIFLFLFLFFLNYLSFQCSCRDSREIKILLCFFVFCQISRNLINNIFQFFSTRKTYDDFRKKPFTFLTRIQEIGRPGCKEIY